MPAPEATPRTTPSRHRLRRVDYQYLILLLAPTLSHLSVKSFVRGAAFATGVPPDSHAFHRYTSGIPSPYKTQARQARNAVPVLSLGFHIRLDRPPACALRPVYLINACTSVATAAAGTELKLVLSAVSPLLRWLTINTFLPAESTLQTRKASFIHAAWLHQAFAPIAIFPTAASP